MVSRERESYSSLASLQNYPESKTPSFSLFVFLDFLPFFFLLLELSSFL
jgi:hypothetical protein